jgi:hypothetical protein
MTQFNILKKFVDRHPACTWRPSPEDIEGGEVLAEGPEEKCYRQQPWKNGRGNTVHPGSQPQGDRYLFDFRVCAPAFGWVQYDTDQDASYFGVWVHAEERLTFTYCEGDLSLVQCETEESFQAELKDMARCYGSPPPAFRVIGEGYRAEVYATENAHGREIPAGGIEVPTMADAAKLVLS